MTDKQAPLAFLDTETTGLHPELHHIWEVGLIVRRGGAEVEYLWQLPVDLSSADPFALDIGGFWERRWPEATNGVQTENALHGGVGRRGRLVPLVARETWCDRFVELTHGCHLVGNVVSFDAERLAALLRWEQRTPTWHYHIVDSEALAAGHLGIEPPWDSEDITRRMGITPPDDGQRHTALGDARWCRDMYDAVLAARR